MNKDSLKAYSELINQLWESVGKKEMNDKVQSIINEVCNKRIIRYSKRK